MLYSQAYSNSLIFILCYSLAWIYAYYHHRRKCDNEYGSGSFILLTYLLYAISSFFLYKNNAGDYGSMTLFPFIYLFTLLYIGLMPVMSYDRAGVSEIIPPPKVVIVTFCVFYVISTLLILPSTLSSINEGLTRLLVDSSGGSELYEERLSSGRQEDYGISNVFSIIYNIFSDCAVLVYFYYLTFPKKKVFLITILTLSILTSILVAFATGNRTQVTFIALSLPASYLLFRKFYDGKIKKIFAISGISVAFIVAFLFVTLTISRFGDLDEGGLDSMLYYLGQANLYFNKYAFNLGGVRYGDRTINLFKKLAGFDVPTGIFDTRSKYSYMTADDSIFTTYIGDFVIDFGPWITPILVIVFTVFILSRTKANNGVIEFYKLIPIHYVMNVCVKGGMYLFCYPFLSNLQIMAYIFFYLCCKYIVIKNPKY